MMKKTFITMLLLAFLLAMPPACIVSAQDESTSLLDTEKGWEFVYKSEARFPTYGFRSPGALRGDWHELYITPVFILGNKFMSEAFVKQERGLDIYDRNFVTVWVFLGYDANGTAYIVKRDNVKVWPSYEKTGYAPGGKDAESIHFFASIDAHSGDSKINGFQWVMRVPMRTPIRLDFVVVAFEPAKDGRIRARMLGPFKSTWDAETLQR